MRMPLSSTQVIKEPMDLGTITERLRTLHYRSADECVADFKLMCRNCRTYNNPEFVCYFSLHPQSLAQLYTHYSLFHSHIQSATLNCNPRSNFHFWSIHNLAKPELILKSVTYCYDEMQDPYLSKIN